MRPNRAATLAPEPPGSGCTTCDPHGRPGYVPAASAFGEGVPVWRRCPAHCGPANRQHAAARRAARAAWRPAPRAAVVPAPKESADRPAPARRAAAPARRRPAPEQRGPELVAAIALDVDDAGGLAVDVDGLPVPEGKTLAHLFAWIASGLPLGADRLHKDGRRANGVICLSESAAKVLRLPAKLPEGAALAKLDKRVRDDAAKAGLSVGQTIGARMRVYATQAPARGARVSVLVVIVPWLGLGDVERQITGAYAERLALGTEGRPDARTLARRMRAFTADVGLPPLATAAVTARDLLDAVRPRETWNDNRRRVLKPGALPSGDLCVPVAAGSRHPLTLEHQRHQLPICVEEDYHWLRQPTEGETARPWAVAVDVSASYLSVTESLRVPVGALEHTDSPVWTGKDAGLWLCDFTGIETEAELPHPASFDGRPPSGPGWYATPTVAYMVSAYGFDPATITEAYVSTMTAALFKEWAPRVRQAYKTQLARLGLVDGLDGTEFLTAHAARKDHGGDQDRADALVLVAAYQDLYKKGVGRWSYSAGELEDPEWLEKVARHWSYRPEIRFHVIAAARIATHRRIRKTFQLTGRAPFSVEVDSLLYACEEEHPLPLIPRDADGNPISGALRLGTAPGSVKHDKTIPMPDVVDYLATALPFRAFLRQYGPNGFKEA